MLKLNAAAFHRAVSTLRYAQTAVKFQGAAYNPAAHLVNDQMGSHQHRQSIESVEELQGCLQVLGTKVTALAVDELLQEMAKTPISYQSFADAILAIDASLTRELSLTSVFVVEREKTKYFEPDSPLFGSEVDTKFTSATFEIDEATKCLALNRATAAVFHAMRATEIAIRAVARCLGIPDPVKPSDRNWGVILKTIQTEFTRRNSVSPKLWPVPGDKELFDQLYTSLDAVRNTWRNTTMHVENKYTDEEAEHIFSAVGAFMRKMATRMDEAGLPPA